MSILQKAENQMAYGKVGIFGFQGSGKTYTATLMAMGICELTKNKKLAYFDTETGSDWLIPKLKEAGCETFVVKSKAFVDLCETIRECEANNIPVLIIDSITHVWRELMESYDKKLHRNGRLQFQDWAKIKGEWREYTDLFVNSKVHIIACGRAGYDYDYDFNEDGTKDLIKTNTKMKAESEFGFEPSLVIEMERISENTEQITELANNRTKKQSFKPKVGSRWIHRAHVLKDRADKINGQTFDYPTFDSFKPHFDSLNIGGAHLGVDTTRNSEERFDLNGDGEWRQKQKRRAIALEEVQNYLVEMWPGQTKEEKQAKLALVEEAFGTNSWTKVENDVDLIDLEITSRLLASFRFVVGELLDGIDGDLREKIKGAWKRFYKENIAKPIEVPQPENKKAVNLANKKKTETVVAD
jgi:hypothetical protein